MLRPLRVGAPGPAGAWRRARGAQPLWGQVDSARGTGQNRRRHKLRPGAPKAKSAEH